MSVDPTLTNIWSGGDVFIADSLSTANPADASAAWPVGWNQVGLLDGGEGFVTDAGHKDVKKHFAWGDRLYKITRRGWEETKKFTALEDNAVTRALMFPGSNPGEIAIPVVQNVKIGFELTEGGKTKRWITKNYAQIDIDGSLSDNENDATKIPLIANIFPDANGVRWVELKKPAITSIAITGLTLALSLAGAYIKKLVATATYSDSSTGDVTDSAVWTSSVPAKATVLHGVVEGLVAGTTNVTCAYGGVTATAPCVVTVSA